MKDSIITGLSFGLTSGVITTLGLLIGLYSATNSKIAIIGGILTIAIADALSDSFGIHISEESIKKKEKFIWEATFSTFINKFLFAITFIIPILFLPTKMAVWVSSAWGLFLIITFTYFISKKNKIPVLKAIIEHIILTLLVITISYLVGIFVDSIFT